MKMKTFLVVMIFALTTVMWAQNAPVKISGTSHSGGQLRAEHRQEMMEMHKQEMEAMKADVEKMKSSLAQMKANLLTIRERNELDRWRNNVDMWEDGRPHGSDAKAHGVHGTRHERPFSRCTDRKETRVTAVQMSEIGDFAPSIRNRSFGGE